MHLTRLGAGSLFCLLCCVLAGRAEAPPSPLRLVHPEADVLLEVKQPRALVEAFTQLDQVKQLKEFEAAREFLDSTSFRRFVQLVAYFEKELGATWPDLLDRLGAGGAVLAI